MLQLQMSNEQGQALIPHTKGMNKYPLKSPANVIFILCATNEEGIAHLSPAPFAGELCLCQQ